MTPAAGWGVSKASGRPTFTVHGPSFTVTPPTLEGHTCWFIARHGAEYTTWTYKPKATVKNRDEGQTPRSRHALPGVWQR